MVRIESCNNMFWGVTIDAGKRYSQTVEQGFQLSMAALENKTGSKEFVQVMLQHESSEYLLCTLQHGHLLQQPLDLGFATGEQVSFSLNGSGVVHLTGYLTPDQDESDMGEEFSESDEDAPELVSAQEMGGKRKAEPALKKSKKIKLLNDKGEEEDEESEDDSDSEEEEDFSDDFDDTYFDEQDSEEDEEENEDDDDDEDDDDEEDEEEEMEVTFKKEKKTSSTPQPKQTKQTDQKTPQTNNKKSPKEKEPNSKKSKSTNANDTPKQTNVKESAETPSTANGEDASSKKKKKKKKKKNKSNDAENSSVNESKTETPSATKKKVVGGGTLVEDLKVGNGPEAKPGKMVSVYYVGTLAKNNKRFDSCTGGKPFRFRLNQGEVIKGWDNGVAGMKVGGKRRLTVPASQGYGNTKQGPIPPNSTLMFEVELKAVS